MLLPDPAAAGIFRRKIEPLRNVHCEADHDYSGQNLTQEVYQLICNIKIVEEMSLAVALDRWIPMNSSFSTLNDWLVLESRWFHGSHQGQGYCSERT